MEVMSEVKVFQVKMKCDKCKEGYMVREDTILTFHPPLYVISVDMLAVIEELIHT